MFILFSGPSMKMAFTRKDKKRKEKKDAIAIVRKRTVYSSKSKMLF